MKGLLQLLASLLDRRNTLQSLAVDPHEEPAISHGAVHRAEDVSRAIGEVENAIQEDQQLIADIEVMITRISRFHRKSDHRDQALRDLENASMRLRRELGDLL